MKKFIKPFIIYLLTLEARFVLWRRKPRIIAVTGSVGKTTAKDAIFSALQSSVSIRKNQKSFNSEIGVPLTILGLPTAWSNPFHWIITLVRGFLVMFSLKKYPEWLVLEAGIDRPGDMEKLLKWVKPNVAVFTAFPHTPVHVEFFPSPEDVWNEKFKLAEGLVHNGIVVANADDANIMKKVTELKKRTYTFGYADDATISALPYELAKDANGEIEGITFKIKHNNNLMPVVARGVVGKQHVYPMLSAIAVGVALGYNPVTLVDSLRSHIAPKGRMNLLKGINDSLIIDDTYNASPVAVEAAITTLKQIEGNKKIAVLGDMLELGSVSAKSHQAIGEYVAVSKVDLLFTVGVRAEAIANTAKELGMSEDKIFVFKKSSEQDLVDKLREVLEKGDVVLIKGSQGSRMERVTESILDPNLDPSKVLVRQEDIWKKKK